MEFDHRLPNGGMNVVYLSSLCGKGDEQLAGHHRCNHSCQVEHVWANLYRCSTTGSHHVCDKNCNQRILYDNLSSICRVSGQIFPLTPAEKEAAANKRKRETPPAPMSPSPDGGGSCCRRVKNRRCETVSASPRRGFESMFQIVVPAASPSGFGQCSMDLS